MKYYIGIVVVLCALCIGYVCSDISTNGPEITAVSCNSTDKVNCTQEVRTKGQKWIAMDKLLKDFVSYGTRRALRALNPEDIANISPQCFSHILKISTGLRQMKLWAFQILDTMGKIPNGVSNGGLFAFGDFDGCLDINVTGHFQGKSCVVELIPPLPEVEPISGAIEHIPELETKFPSDTLIGSIDSMLKPHYDSFVLRIAACVPSSCTEQDVQFMAEKALEIVNIEWDARVQKCEVKEGVRIENWDDYTSLCVVGALVVLVISATLTDAFITYSAGNNDHRINAGTPFRIFLCFSMLTNTAKLLRNDESEGAIKIFYGLKTVTILWVMLNHTYSFVPVELVHRAIFLRDVGNDFAFQPVINGYPSVDTFFFISGVLLMYGWMNARTTKITFLGYFTRRYWRLTPPVMLVAAFELLVYRFGSGPMWHTTFKPWVVNCRERWWANLLYVNNYFGYDEACLGWTWYLACDMQLYLNVFLIILTIKRRPKVALSALAVMSVISVGLIIGNQFYYSLPPLLSPANSMSISNMYYFVKYGYFRAHLHAVVYFIGMGVGYVLYYKSKIQISPRMSTIGWLISLTSGMAVVYSGYFLQDQDAIPISVAAVYNAGSKIIWSLSLGWVTIACCTGNGGFVTKLLSYPAFIPLARLTFITYLVSPIIQLAYYASTRVPIQTDHRTMTFMYLSFVLASFMTAYFLSMLFEAPFIALERVVFRTSSSAKQTEEVRDLNNHIKKQGIENGSFKQCQNDGL